MKKTLLLGNIAAMSVIFAGCSGVSPYTSGKNVNPGSVTCTIGDETVVIEPLNTELDSDFMRGFDASAVNDDGMGSYFTANNSSEDIFKILPSYGINWTRLRVWNNPKSEKNPRPDSNKKYPGNSSKEVVVSQAVRAKKAGLKVLLDFHYSDYWADPGKQLIPEDWLNCTTSDELAGKVYEYTKEVLTEMKNNGAEPNMIQIGNEISSGILLHNAISEDESKKTPADDAVRGDFAGENYFKYLSSGIKAAREICPGAKIMLHFTDIKRNNPLNFLGKFSSLDYDVVGLSYYSEWQSHGTLTDLGNIISGIKNTFGKDAVVVETNVHHTTASEVNGVKVLSDTHKANLIGEDGKTYPGLLTDSSGNVLASVQNQANIVRAVIEVTSVNGGKGVFEWGGEYKGAWNSMFSGDGKPLPSIAVFKIQ